VKKKGKGGRKRRERDNIMDRIKKLLEDDTLTPNFFINGLSPLVMAVRMPTEPWLLEALLQHGQVDVNMTDCEGRSALSYAAEFQQAQSLKRLLGKGAKHDLQDSGGRTPLSWAATAGEPYHFLPDTKEVIEELLAAGADVNAEDWKKRTPLAWATIKGNKDTTELLLSVDNLNADIPDTDGRTPLSHAAELDLVEIIQLLLNSKADINLEDKRGRTPLLWAAQTGHQTIVSKLLASAGVNVDYPDSDGRTPLSHAAELGPAGIVQLLLDSNADINLKDKRGRTPLLWATQEGHQTLVSKLLASAGVDVDHPDPDGRAPLSHSAELGRREIIQLLLTSRADINLEDKLGRTPLLWATRKGHETIVSELLASAGVNVDRPDSEG
jgi:ankyrin repeat protein